MRDGVLAEYFRIQPDPPAEQEKLLERWFWVTSFTGWFGLSNPTMASRALDEIRELAEGRRTRLQVVDLEMPAQPFPVRFDGRSARVRAFLLYLVSLHPQSIYGDGELSSGALLSELGFNALANVYTGIQSKELASSPANRMLADRHHRGQVIGELEQAAREGREGLDTLLDSHGFPLAAKALLATGDREGAIAARLEHLIKGERAFLEERQVTCPSEQTSAVYRDSDASDEE